MEGKMFPSFRLVAVVLLITVVSTTASAQECKSLLKQVIRSLDDNSNKQLISLERQFLTYCGKSLQPADYAGHLQTLATGLNGDSQHQEALSVADRCLQINAEDLSCLFEKANALYHLGRLPEAKSLIEKSLALAAITEVDAAAKQALQNLLTRVKATVGPRPSERTPPKAQRQ
jgi:tetratricopeptide (TPR) repeat protein